ncbi:MAG: PIG-L family deacetylase [Opitutaceae bacterium]|nr:PIG-L family deacetylase [Opitutaceae bacterium]
MNAPRVLAIAAHPDDIEFMMAGTLLELQAAGYEAHYLNVADGSCGSHAESAVRTRKRRAGEARAAARILGARHHPSLARDVEIFYEPRLLRRIAAVVRMVAPSIVLTHSPEDYMEDHTNTARLAATALFVRGMPNYRTQPPRTAIDGNVTIYHALPHGLRDAMGRLVIPESYVDVKAVHALKLDALAAHKSQQQWLTETQGMSSYLASMEAMSREVGRMSGRFRLAEGWRRHNPLGFCPAGADPMRDALGRKHLLNRGYPRGLDARDAG